MKFLDSYLKPFQFYKVRLKVYRIITISDRERFQFYKVRLKDVQGRGQIEPVLFQFYKVRLKGFLPEDQRDNPPYFNSIKFD